MQDLLEELIAGLQKEGYTLLSKGDLFAILEKDGRVVKISEDPHKRYYFMVGYN